MGGGGGGQGGQGGQNLPPPVPSSPVDFFAQNETIKFSLVNGQHTGKPGYYPQDNFENGSNGKDEDEDFKQRPPRFPFLSFGVKKCSVRFFPVSCRGRDILICLDAMASWRAGTLQKIILYTQLPL